MSSFISEVDDRYLQFRLQGSRSKPKANNIHTVYYLYLLLDFWCFEYFGDKEQSRQ